ncbi:MAG: M23 family metallopeptidase [Leptospiraceae bacterium]|nr:M23 family metallopeptidase [Leptospiraceae bacterium]MCP5492978.1 M23 family metallopeptidase [Leptospiraceae bacterium]
MRSILICLLTICFSSASAEQTKNYIWPVQGNQVITGSFGEFRHNHFHMGMDFATESKVGIPIVAINNGKIIKIENSSYSYGNTVSILHNDGVVSRYCHLSGFSPVILRNIIDQKVLDKLKRRVEFDYTMEDGIRVKQGDVIAFSGDTGAGPPHLHMELSKNGVHLNPVDFGYNKISGIVTILGLEVKPFDENTYINGRNRSFYPKLIKQPGNNYIYYGRIKVQGKVAFSISGHETSGYSNKIGFQKISIQLGNKILQEINFKQIPKENFYWLPLVMDSYRSRINGEPYKYFLYSRSNYPVFVLKNPNLGAGIINSEDLYPNQGNEVTIKAYGIKTRALIKLKLIPDAGFYKKVFPKKGNVSPEKESTLVSSDGKAVFHFPKKSVLTETDFKITERYTPKSRYGLTFKSKAYTISPFYAEFNEGFDLSIKVDEPVHTGKTGLYRLSKSGIPYKLLDFKYSRSEKTFKTRVNRIGTYAVVTDYTKPSVKIHQYGNFHTFHGGNFKLYLRVYDTGSKVLKSGLAVMVDEKEAYVDYDPETGLREIFYPDSMYEKGKHVIEAMATDQAGNDSSVLRYYYTVK